MKFTSAFILLLAVTLTGCAYDTYGNSRRGSGNSGYGNGSNSRTERAASDNGYRDGVRQGRARQPKFVSDGRCARRRSCGPGLYTRPPNRIHWAGCCSTTQG